MNRRTSSLAVDVIRQADRDRPADAVLRNVIREDRRITPPQAREIADAVYAYFRWRGWLSEDYPLAQQIVYANKLQADFISGERVLSDDNLMRKTVPGWVGREMQATLPWLKTLQLPAPVWLRCPPGTREVVAETLGDCEIPPEPPDALIYKGAKDLFKTGAFRAGRFEMQDASSQRVSLITAPKPGETWWDACAGEGGKTMYLSALMQNKGLIWASDRAEWRLKKLKQRASRGGVFNYRTVLWDGGERPPTKTMFDGILVDAPCTGLGTWQRNPHARWTVTPDDVEELATAQLALLMHVAPSLKPGGRLVYAVCTLTRRETVDVMRRFERHTEVFERLEVPDTEKGFLWPQTTGGNGMFVAVWKKKA